MVDPEVCLVHWKEETRKDRVLELRQRGFKVIFELPIGSKLFRMLEDREPEALVIDLTHIPSQGRDLGVAIRKRKGTRNIPIVFAGGEQAKVEKIKELLPDAYYCEWVDIEATLHNAVMSDPNDLVVPESVFAAYAGKPLVTKLGISEGNKVALVNAPKKFEETLGDLPPKVSFSASPDESTDLVLWFVISSGDLRSDMERVVNASQTAPIWIAWPKKSSKIESDLSQSKVREMCMDAGMVDYKVCSIDTTWTGLLFTWRG